jgi:hypothetical protein
VVYPEGGRASVHCNRYRALFCNGNLQIFLVSQLYDFGSVYSRCDSSLHECTRRLLEVIVITVIITGVPPQLKAAHYSSVGIVAGVIQSRVLVHVLIGGVHVATQTPKIPILNWRQGRNAHTSTMNERIL